MKKCKRCELDLGSHHGNRQYHPECKTAATNEARRAKRALKRDTNCKRCHLDLGPHHGNREYHPECQKAGEEENRSARRRAVNRDKENEQQRARYYAKRASKPLLTVKCSYVEKGVHAFKTRDQRLSYCCDDHREFGQRIVQRAADRRGYVLNPQRHKDKNKANYARRSARLLPPDLRSKPKTWRVIVPLLIAERDLSNAEVQQRAGTKLDKETMRRIRRYCGVRGTRQAV